MASASRTSRRICRTTSLMALACLALGTVRGSAQEASPASFAHAGKPANAVQLAAHVAPRSWKFIVLHHTATSAGTVEGIDAEHRARRDADGNPWRGIGYHFLIGNGRGMADGEVRATFRWQEQLAGAHAGINEYNNLGIGVCLVGNFEETPPTPAQIASLRDLCRQLGQEYSLAGDQIMRHTDLKATACPGKLFDRSIVFPHQPAPAVGK